jgi:iron complex transport system substrate-binding protein
MLRKILFPISMLIILSMALAACAGEAQTPSEVPTVSSVSAVTSPTMQPTATTEPTAIPAFPMTITDGAGREVTLEATPERIISLSPSNTEILFAVGAGDSVVGDTDYCNYPEEAAGLQKVGGYSADSISIETIVSLDPDLVLADASGQETIIEALERSNIPVIAVKSSSFEDVYANIEMIGTASGHKDEATALVDEMKARVAAVTEKIKDIPEADRPTVFWEVWDEPLMTIGPNTFTSQTIEMAGGVNIFADLSEDYPPVSDEEVVNRNPDFIMGPDSMGEKLTTSELASRPGWDKINAVINNHIVLLDGDISSRPGPRIVDALETIAKALYPDLFSE